MDVMHNEWSRFGSFLAFPANAVAKPIRLAKAGFCYTGSGEEAICFCCGVRNDIWTEGESLLEVHRRLSPHCRFVCGADTTNIAIHEDNGLKTVSKCLNKVHGNSAFKTSESKSDIESTHAAEQPNEIFEDERNLYVSGTSPRHASTEISTVNQGVTNQEYGMTTKSVSSLTNGQIEIYPGISHSRPKHSEYALLSERLASFLEWPARHVADPNVLAKAGFYSAGIQDCVRCFFCNGGMKNWQTGDNPWVEHAKWFPNCAYLKLCKGEAFVNICSSSVNADIVTVYDNESQMDQENCPDDWLIENINSAAAKIVLSVGYKQEDVEKGVMFARQKYGPTKIKAQFIMEYMLEAKKAVFYTTASSNREAQNVKRKDKPQNVISNATETNDKRKKQKLEEENRKLKDLIACKICLDNEDDTFTEVQDSTGGVPDSFEYIAYPVTQTVTDTEAMGTDSSFGGLPIPPIITNRTTDMSDHPNRKPVSFGDTIHGLNPHESRASNSRQPNPNNFANLPIHQEPTGCSDRRRETQHTDSSDDFSQYVRRRTKRFYVGGFRHTITEAKLANHVGDRGPKVTKVSIFRNKKSRTTVVRINVEDNDMANLLVNDPYFWPQGIQCRPWLSQNSYRNRNNDIPLDQREQKANNERSRYPPDAWHHNRYRGGRHNPTDYNPYSNIDDDVE